MKDIYVKFDGTELAGDSTDAVHKGQIEATSFSHRITQPKSSTASTAGGHTAERTEHGEILLTKEIDRATPKAFRACSAGTVYKSCTIYLYRSLGGPVSSTSAGNKRINYLTIELSDVILSSMSTEVGGNELPTETMGLKYGKIVWTYTTSDTAGAAGQKQSAVGWDLRNNTAS